MKKHPSKNQAGFALLMFVLAFMSVGGVLLIGYSQGILEAVEAKKFEHNKRVLKEAKQALLQFAYNYPQFFSEGPGRLPCPSPDTTGLTGGLTLALCQSVGRLPWAEPEMNFYDARDADGEQLWYAVSDNFYNLGGGPVINSDSVGTITIIDQTGVILYDGAASGIAAVIIAPGPAISRDEDGNGTYETPQLRGTAAQQIDEKNYLDTFAGFDNSVFNNGESDTDDDGFILGPVFDSTQNVIVVNDQIIVITAAEVLQMAEKATLQAYRTAIKDYRNATSPFYCDGETPDGATTEADCLAATIPGTWAKGPYCEGETPDGATTEADCLAATTPGTWTLGPYPWLYNYTGVPDVSGLRSYYPADSVWATELGTNLDNFGRIPSIFGDYFTAAGGARNKFQTELSGSIGFTMPETVTCTGCPNNMTMVDDEFKFSDFGTVKIPDYSFTQVVTDAEFVNIAGNDGRLTGNAASALSDTMVLYFWDDDADPDEFWRPCGDDGDGIPELTDCNRDSSGLPKPGGTNDTKSWILRMEVDITFPYAAGAVSIDMDYTTPPAFLLEPATGTSHAMITATFDDIAIINSTMPTLSNGTWELDEHYHTDEGAGDFDSSEDGDIDESVFIIDGSLSLSIRYFPILPAWVFDNGWHDSVMMAYAFDYRPGQVAPCSEATDCIQINNLAGNNDNKISILTIAGQHDWNDQGSNGLFDDVGDVFDVENEDLDRIFDARAVSGNDRILIIEECAIAACP